MVLYVQDFEEGGGKWKIMETCCRIRRSVAVSQLFISRDC